MKTSATGHIAMTPNQIAVKAAAAYYAGRGITARKFATELAPYIQAAISEATAELSRACFDLTEQNAELLSQQGSVIEWNKIPEVKALLRERDHIREAFERLDARMQEKK